MPNTSIISTPSLPSFNPNFYEPSTTEPDPGSANANSPGPSSKLRDRILGVDNRSDAELFDPYKLFIAACRKYHGHRTKKGHSFHAKKLRWLWYHSKGNNGPFPALWTRKTPTTYSNQPQRKRNDELAITVRCLSGGFSKLETEAVIKAWGEHSRAEYDFMAMTVYKATTFVEAMKFTAPIREGQAKERTEKYWTKTASRILWALEKSGPTGATPTQIAAVAGRDVQAVKQRLKRLCGDGQVVKIKRGVYGLAVL
jgi:phosphopantetheinyl transferase (holo-ACP synthase)